MQENDKAHSILSVIKERFEQTNVKWAVFAEAAAFCYGSKRQVTDIDILVRCEDLEKAKSALKDVKIEGFDVGCGAEIKTSDGSCLFFLDDEMVEKRKWKRLFDVDVPVMSVEDNIVFKAILQRGEDKGKYDIEDIRQMIQHQNIDLSYLKRRIKKCRCEKRVKSALQAFIPNL